MLGFNLHFHTVRSQGTIILADTGAGNGKERPYAPAYAHHDTAYLDNLRAVGVLPEDVDIVINTHLHGGGSAKAARLAPDGSSLAFGR